MPGLVVKSVVLEFAALKAVVVVSRTSWLLPLIAPKPVPVESVTTAHGEKAAAAVVPRVRLPPLARFRQSVVPLARSGKWCCWW